MNKNRFFTTLLFVFSFALYSFSSATSLVNTQTLDLKDVNLININYIADDVTFYENDGNELIVKEYMNQSKPDYFARISTSGKALNVEHGQRPWFSFLISNVEIYLPKHYKGALTIKTVSGRIISNMDWNLQTLNAASTSGSISLKNLSADNVNLKTTSGRIQTGDINADVEISSTSGQVQMNNIVGNSNVMTTSARIQVESIQGNSFLKSTSGSIVAGKLLGAKQEITTNSGLISLDEIRAEIARIKSISGAISVERAFGKLSANSTSGKITIAKAGGNANLSTVSGAIQANYGFVDGDIFIKTTSGKVSLSIPDNLSYYFNASTNSGSVRTAFSDGNINTFKSVSRQVGSVPTSSIEINTVSGSIDLNTRPAMKNVQDLPRIL